VARALGLLGDGGGGAGGGNEPQVVLPFLPRLSSLSLEWPGDLSNSLAPLASLTRLTALRLCGHAEGAMEADWLPPNLEELSLAAGASRHRMRGIGGAGWLAALDEGACPKLRALRLDHLTVRDVRPGSYWHGLTLASTLPRLAALEQLVVVDAYESTDIHAYKEGESDDEFIEYARPIPAAPLLAAMPALRHCQAGFVRSRPDRLGEEYRVWNFGDDPLEDYRSASPMLLATPAELATLHAPRLESLSIGLVTSSDVKDKAWRCSRYNGSDDDDDDDDESDESDSDDGSDDSDGAQARGAAGMAADAPPAAAAVPAAASIPIGSGLPALRSMELHVGCTRAAGGDGSVWDLSALPPGSLPALRRLLVLPISFGCGTAKLPLEALARAAPGLERLAIDPRCAGPLDELFCNGSCAFNLRSLVVLPAPRRETDAPARLYSELRFGLCMRAAVARRRFGKAAPHLNVTLLHVLTPKSDDGGAAAYPPESIYGATVVRRPFYSFEDGSYIDHCPTCRRRQSFGTIGTRRASTSTSASTAREYWLFVSKGAGRSKLPHSPDIKCQENEDKHGGQSLFSPPCCPLVREGREREDVGTLCLCVFANASLAPAANQLVRVGRGARRKVRARAPARPVGFAGWLVKKQEELVVLLAFQQCKHHNFICFVNQFTTFLARVPRFLCDLRRWVCCTKNV
jgi:hypothetical protein